MCQNHCTVFKGIKLLDEIYWLDYWLKLVGDYVTKLKCICRWSTNYMHLHNALKMENRKGIHVVDSETMKYNRIFLHEVWQVSVPAMTYLYSLIIIDFRENENVYSFGEVKLNSLNWIYVILSLLYISASLESYYQAIKSK
jgi:hypothetical protein